MTMLATLLCLLVFLQQNACIGQRTPLPGRERKVFKIKGGIYQLDPIVDQTPNPFFGGNFALFNTTDEDDFERHICEKHKALYGCTIASVFRRRGCIDPDSCELLSISNGDCLVCYFFGVYLCRLKLVVMCDV